MRATDKMSRFFVDKSQIIENIIQIRDGDDIKHIKKVLRLSPGDKIEISDSEEFEYVAEIIVVAENRVDAVILDKQRFAREPELKVTLFQGIPKQGKMEVIIQKCVELGVNRIVPVFTKRTVVTEKGNKANKLERWQKISDEAVKQCRRGLIPKVETPVKMEEMIEQIRSGYDLVLFLYENEDKTTIKDVLRGISSGVKGTAASNIPKTVGLIIGPEGGFSDEEAILIRENGGVCASLGKTILRTETAGAAAIAMAMYEFEL